MAKPSALARVLAKIDADIALLQAMRDRLLVEASAQPKRRPKKLAKTENAA